MWEIQRLELQQWRQNEGGADLNDTKLELTGLVRSWLKVGSKRRWWRTTCLACVDWVLILLRLDLRERKVWIRNIRILILNMVSDIQGEMSRRQVNISIRSSGSGEISAAQQPPSHSDPQPQNRSNSDAYLISLLWGLNEERARAVLSI